MIAEPLEGSIPAPPRPRRHRARTRGRRRDNRGRAGPRSDVPSQVTER
jgi:hypothetical protein